MIDIKPSEITPEHIYLSRRRFMKGVGALVANSMILAACGVQDSETGVESPATATAGPTASATSAAQPTASAMPTFPPLIGSTDESGAPLTSFEAITGYVNYYEFTTRKEGVAKLAEDYVTSPWSVRVGGLVNKPRTFDLDDLLKYFFFIK